MSPTELELLCVKPAMTLRDALLRMEQVSRGILLVLDDAGKLARTLTDGDLRRAILKGSSDSTLLGALPVAHPITASEEADATDVLRLMDLHQIDICQLLMLSPSLSM